MIELIGRFPLKFWNKPSAYCCALLCLLICAITACDSEDYVKVNLPNKEEVNKLKDTYHFQLTQAQKEKYQQYLSNLSPEEREERNRYYCGLLGDKYVRLPKEYALTPFIYNDISFRKNNGWQAKMRWCDERIAAYSIIVNWPDRTPGRDQYGFNHLAWGTYDEYLIEDKKAGDRDYSNAAIYLFGDLNQFDDANIKNHPGNLRTYLESLFRKYKLGPNTRSILKQELSLEEVEAPFDGNQVATIYWHRTTNNKNQADLAIECLPVPGRIYSWCTAYFFPKNIPNIIASFVVIEDNLSHWPELIKQAESLFRQFIYHYSNDKKK